ncbi:MAG: hypothetical protein R6V06_06370 [Kiritimatiellia bacterium]
MDHHDFSGIEHPSRKGAMMFDTETAEGCVKVLDHVVETGARTILWRPCSGATMRYQSKEEKYPWVQSPLDKRRLPENRPVQGWLRYYEAKPDILRNMMKVIKGRTMSAGVHWPFEETHWKSWTFGAWNFEHPQYWGVTRSGRVWAGRCSLAYPEVVEHKLRLVDEMTERGIDHMMIDTWRNGAWGPRFEYVEPEIARWRKRYGSEPPEDANDPQWCAFIAETTHDWFVALRRRLDASGRNIRLMIGVKPVGMLNDEPDATLLRSGVDWKRLVDEGVVDAVVVMGVSWDRRHAFASTRKIYRNIISFCDDRCQVFFPVQAYDFIKRGMPSYQKATGLSQDAVAEKLLRIAWEEGADGICMEVVDYNNYKPETRRKMKNLLEGPCRFKR